MQARVAEGRDPGLAEPTRMVALGSAALTDGFRLIGFEAMADATPEDLDELLRELQRSRERALLVLEHQLARSGSKELERVRAEGGRIVVAEVPPLHAPHDYHPLVEQVVLSVLGAGALEERK